MRRIALAVLAVLLAATAADASIVITVDKSTQRMTVAVDGATRWTWPVSTGRHGRATPAGSFQAFRMERDHFSREFDDAPMPHSIFFTKRGHAIHGSYETRRLGTPASSGCVRLSPDNARELFALVEERGVLNTKVVITGEEPRITAPPAVAKQTPRTPQEQAAPLQVAPQRASPQYAPPRSAQPRAPRQQEQYDTYGRTVGAAPVYREPPYPPPTYRRPQPGYENLPPPPPGYMYAPPPPPAGYYYR